MSFLDETGLERLWTHIIAKLSGKVDKTKLSLGKDANGLLYIYIDGMPVGTGITLPTGGIDGYITNDKKIIFENLPDGEYTLAYVRDDGSIVPIGSLEKDTNVYYTITNSLINCVSSNSATEAIGGQPYSTVISANDGYELSSVTVTNGGESVSVSDGIIEIAEVKGDIVITAIATPMIKFINFADPTSADWLEPGRISNSGIGGVTSSSANGLVATNYIPVEVGDVLEIGGAAFKNKSSTYYRFAVYSGTTIETRLFNDTYTASNDYVTKLTDNQLEITSADVKYIRLTLVVLTESSAITVHIKRNGNWLIDDGDDTPTYINLAEPDATATGETAWNSGGWCNNSYMAGTSYAYRSGEEGRITTNTFAVGHGNTIYVKGIKYAEDSTCQIATFDASGNYLKHASAYHMDNSQGYVAALTGTVGEDYWSFKNTGANGVDVGVRFIRISGYLSGDISDVIITRNQPIESVEYYSVTNNLTNCVSNNSATQAVGGESYSATITANDGYELSSVIVTMSGTDVSSTAVSGGTISIAEVTGDIVITAVAIVNLIPKSTDASGNLYVGTNGEAGYKTACRIRGTGEEHAYEGYSCTGFIPVTTGEKLYMYGMYADDVSGNSRIALYKKDKTVVRSDIYPTKVGANGDYIDEGNGIYSYTIVDADVAFARISVKKIMDGSEIVTVNQPIV